MLIPLITSSFRVFLPTNPTVFTILAYYCLIQWIPVIKTLVLRTYFSTPNNVLITDIFPSTTVTNNI